MVFAKIIPFLWFVRGEKRRKETLSLSYISVYSIITVLLIKLWEGNVFRPVCLSFCSTGLGWSQYRALSTPPRTGPHPHASSEYIQTSSIWNTNSQKAGWLAFDWNAFLLKIYLSHHWRCQPLISLTFAFAVAHYDGDFWIYALEEITPMSNFLTL